jgi:hypothetical protein
MRGGLERFGAALLLAWAGGCSSTDSAGGDAVVAGDGSLGGDSATPGSGGTTKPATGGSTGSGGAGRGGSGASDAAGSGGAGANGVVVTISPASGTLVAKSSQYFTCTVTGEANASCTWKVTEPNGGTISAAGLYVAPDGAGTFHVVATSPDSADSATATVTVTAQVGGCNNLAAVGTWENITPPQIDYSNWCIPGSASCKPGQLGTYGVNEFVLDPNHPGTLYLGTAGLGIWKSTNCGSDWVKIDTGQNHAALDAGRQNCFYIDPTNSDVLYTMALYDGAVQGFYQSTNGGVDWTQVVTSDALHVVAGGFFQGVAMDPTDPTHFVAYPHQNCGGTPLPGAAVASDGSWGCLGEGHYVNGSWTWTITTSPFPPGQGDGIALTMLGPKTWLEGGIWRTTTGGVPPNGGWPASAWSQVFTGYVGGCYIASEGTIYCGQAQKPLIYSTDAGVTWTVSNGPSDVAGIVDDGTTLYVSRGPSGNSYFSTPISPAKPVGTFTAMAQNPPGAVWGGFQLAYDKNSNILYSSNLDGGFWRVVTK